MSKLLENVCLIDGERYTRNASVDGIFMGGLGFYLSMNEETMAVVDNETGEVVAEIGINASSSEGGGGYLYVKQ